MPTDSVHTGYLSLPLADVLPAGVSVDAWVLSKSLDRRPRDCTWPSSSEAANVRDFVGADMSRFPAEYVICGRSVFVDWGTSPLRGDEDYMAKPAQHPDADTIVTVESLGDEGEWLQAEVVSGWPYR